MARIKVVIVDFCDVFRHAEKFGVSWNEANDLFFAHVFNYLSCDSVEFIGEHQLDSIEEIAAMDEGHAKAQAILDDFLLSEGLDGKDVRIDAT